jgi:hypothetical protein
MKKHLKSKEKTLPANHPDLATSYNNIVYSCYERREYSKALAYWECALYILESSLPLITHILKLWKMLLKL